jgi:serine/threonine protein kinase
MADSLFDNRYRYDYIYPRGRSGETLRAVDLQDNERPVVIKRPAPNDAPPIRAGQEVSIVNERTALRRLAGHAVLTELLGSGQFFVGGTAHQYIVMERAVGLIVGDYVAELNATGERLPELEMLVIVDNLLSLLEAAHKAEIVYNDVDAKHLFWNRDSYGLKVIDWGNAVFLEGDAITPQGISVQTDIYQVGELLYFMMTGGKRAEIPRDANVNFRLDFGEDVRRVHSRLQEIVSKAAHPNSRLRYNSITDVRKDLADYRQSLERERNTLLASVNDRLRRGNLSKSELRSLQTQLEPAIAQDPGYPAARAALDDITDRLRDLEVQSDLDAVQIYMSNANWTRAADLLRSLRDQTGTRTSGLVSLLLDVCNILAESGLRESTPAINEALNSMFDGLSARAAKVLLVEEPDDYELRTLQWRLAERVSSHVPEVLLLRPNLFRLDSAMRQLDANDPAISEMLAGLNEIDGILEQTANGSTDLPGLRDRYRLVVERLQAMNPRLQTLAVQQQLSNRHLPLTALERGLNAAMALADSMHVIGKQAAASPRDALHSLDASRAIDPVNPVWDEIEELLNDLYGILQACQTFVPAADGSDLEAWFKSVQEQLSPFASRLFDEMLGNMLAGLDRAASAWAQYRTAVVQGNRDQAEAALQSAADAVQTISPTLTTWLRQLHNVVSGADYIERHSVPGGFGRALADGWAAFDRSRLSDAERLGQQAYETAGAEAEYQAASRLQDVAKWLREWVERGGVKDAARSQALLVRVQGSLTPDERETFEGFAEQMPSNDTYLRAMKRGVVDVYQRRSTAALRLVFVLYLMQGALDAHEDRLEDADFWLQAAQKTLADLSERHAATRELAEFVGQRRDLAQAAEIFADLNGKHVLPRLDALRKQVEDSAQSRILAPATQSLRELETAVRDWSDGDFRSAGAHLELALKGAQEAQKNANIGLDAYQDWLKTLLQGAANLNVQLREVRSIVDSRPDDAVPRMQEIHYELVERTERLLSQDYSTTLRQWRDTYDAFLDVFISRDRRSRRLEDLNELFRAMFIDKHPAYPLYQHWYALTERASEFPAPETDDPTPRLDPSADVTLETQADEPPLAEAAPGGRRRILVLLIVGMLLAGAAAFALMSADDNPIGGIALTISATPTDAPASATDAASATPESDAMTPTDAIPTPTVPTTTDIPASDTPDAPTTNPRIVVLPTDTPTATQVPPTATPTDTPMPTNTPTVTLTPSATATPTDTPTPTLPPQGLQGQQDLLALLESERAELNFNPSLFAPGEDGDYWRMGTGTATDGDVLTISPPAALLEDAYGNNAVSRIRRVEADFTLRTHNPTILNEGDLYFGLLLQSTEDGNNAGVRIQVVDATNNIVNIYQVLNNEATLISVRPINANQLRVRLRVDHDPSTGRALLYLNDSLLAEPFEFIEPDTPLLPVLFVKEGGVVVGVRNWRVTLR